MTADRVAAQVPPILAELREATADMHKAVERQTPFFEPAFDRQEFLRWLDVMHPFYGVVDGVVDSSDFPASSGWNYLPRRRMIENDLRQLADRAPASVTVADSPLQAMAALRSVGEVAGMLYVIEGSSLGGQVLLRVLARSAGVTSTHGASFFAPHGDEPREKWMEYIGVLARISSQPDAVAQAVRGAVTTFTALGRWIDAAW